MTNRVWTIAAVVAAAGSALTALVLMALQFGILVNDLALQNGAQSAPLPLRQLLDASSSLSLPYILVELIAVVLLIVWVNRTYVTLPELGAHELQGSPGGAVGWWFVPIANLFKPFQYLREIWRALTPGLTPNDSSSRAKLSGGGIVLALQILAIFTLVLTLVVRGVGQSAATLDGFIRFRALNATLLASRASYVLLSIVFILAVAGRQAKLAAKPPGGGSPSDRA